MIEDILPGKVISLLRFNHTRLFCFWRNLSSLKCSSNIWQTSWAKNMVSIHLQINTWLTAPQDHHRNMLLNEKIYHLWLRKRGEKKIEGGMTTNIERDYRWQMGTQKEKRKKTKIVNLQLSDYCNWTYLVKWRCALNVPIFPFWQRLSHNSLRWTAFPAWEKQWSICSLWVWNDTDECIAYSYWLTFKQF